MENFESERRYEQSLSPDAVLEKYLWALDPGQSAERGGDDDLATAVAELKYRLENRDAFEESDLEETKHQVEEWGEKNGM
jgi:hypothetical protein